MVMSTDPLLLSSLLLTAFCGLAAIGVAVLPIFHPDAAGSPMIEPLFKLLAFVFSIGAGAVLFKALG
jgi:hypothetical protein